MAEVIEGTVYRAESYLALGQIDRADDLVRATLTQHPRDPQLLLALTKVLEHQGRWAEVISAAEATLEADPQLLSPRLMIAWAAYKQGDARLMREQVAIVLEHRPDNPQALMYLAIAEAGNWTPEGRERVRGLYRLSLEKSGGGTPWLVAMAAALEVSLNNQAEAATLIDGGLERFPTDSTLLSSKADLSLTSTDQSVSILEGLLAESPTDPSLRGRLNGLLSRRRRRMLVGLWLVPLLLSASVTLLDGWWRASAVTVIFVLGFLALCVRMSDIQKMSPANRALVGSRARWRVVTRVAGRVSVVSTVIGGLLLASDVAVGGWMLLVSVIGWSCARAASLMYEKADARQLDQELSAVDVTPGDGSGVAGPTTTALAHGRRVQALVTPLLLAPAVLVAVSLMADESIHPSAFTLAAIACLVALMSVAESIGWKRSTLGRRPVLWRVGRVVVPVVFFSAFFVVAVGGLVDATEQTDRDAPPNSPAPTAPARDPDDIVEQLQDMQDRPVPVPTFSVPSFEIPDLPSLDVPTE